MYSPQQNCEFVQGLPSPNFGEGICNALIIKVFKPTIFNYVRFRHARVFFFVRQALYSGVVISSPSSRHGIFRVYTLAQEL